MRILMIGDVIGKPGRRTVQQLLPGLRFDYGLDMVIANGENSAGGRGVTSSTAQELFDAGVNVITTGNHVWAQKEVFPYMNGELPILRPMNYSSKAPGCGFILVGHTLIVNLIGRIFMGQSDCPFQAMDRLLSEIDPEPKIIIVDFHAEATSEKMAMGRYLDGRISAIFGTHTHVGTSDACILPGGTGYVTDVGMVGPKDSIIGDNVDSVLQSFLTNMPHRISIGKGRAIFDAILVDIDETSGKTTGIQRIQREEE